MRHDFLNRFGKGWRQLIQDEFRGCFDILNLSNNELVYSFTTRIMQYQSSHDFHSFSADILALLSSSILEKRVRFLLSIKTFRLSFFFNIFEIVIKWDDALTALLFRNSRFDYFWQEIEKSFVLLCSNYISLESWVTTTLMQDVLRFLYTTSSCAIRCGETNLERYHTNIPIYIRLQFCFHLDNAVFFLDHNRTLLASLYIKTLENIFTDANSFKKLLESSHCLYKLIERTARLLIKSNDSSVSCG